MTVTQNVWISNALILMIILYYSCFLGWFIFVIFLHYGSIIARLYHSAEHRDGKRENRKLTFILYF